MKASCKLCSSPIGLVAEAWICSFECTYCPKCAEELQLACTACGGELVRRPRPGRVSRQAFGAVHRATVSWQGNGAAFVDRRYSRVHRWSFEGGAELVASSSPHVVPVPMSDARAVDPEAAFIASLSSCHMLWFLDLAARAGLVVERYEDKAEGVLVSRAVSSAEAGASPGKRAATASHSSVDARAVLEQITLRPVVAFAPGTNVPRDVLEHLHHEAHEHCFLAQALKVAPRVVIDVGG
jgi:organic hydroperoxide reductase OsmC/OhrA